MNTLTAKSETLLGVALAPLDVVRQVGLVIGFSLLTALAAQVVIPIGPIPITGQTFAVLLTGALLGSRLGAMAIGSVVIMLSGWAWFSVVMHTPPMMTLYATVIKFVPGDIIKIALAAAALPSGWKLVGRRAL